MATAEQAHTPAVTVTPASPTTPTTSSLRPPISTGPTAEMKEKNPTDSETALVAKGPLASMSNEKKADASTSTSATGRTSPLEALTRKLSGKSAPTNAASVTTNDPDTADTALPKQHEKTTTAPAPTTTTSTTAPAASTSRAQPSTTPASKPAQRSTGATTQKKKKKRKGLAGLFVALGCLSADEIDDDAKPQAKRDMSQKTGGGVTKPATTTEAAKPAVAPSAPAPVTATATPVAPTAPTTSATEAVPPQTASTTATTLTETTSQPRADAPAIAPAAVILAPIEPVRVPEDETAGVTSSAVQPPGSGSELLSTPSRPHAVRRESDTPSQSAAAPGSSADLAKTETSGGYTDISESDIPAADDGEHMGDEHEYEEEYEDEEDRLIAQGGMGIPLDENGHPAPLLPPMDKVHHGRKCLVLDLDETLLHSSFKMIPSADYIVPVEIESQVHNVYVIKRPGVDHFLTEMGKIYEVVVFTASLSKYADPVLDMLDPNRVVRHRLFRESCYNHKGNYVKDLSQLGRDMEGCIIIDNSPASYIFHPNNAVPVSTWFNDPHDTELTDLCPFLTDLATVDDIRGVLDGNV